MTRSLVSVVVTTYQRCELAKRAIESVLAQTYESLEVIVVEDGSTSGIDDWLQQHGFENIRYIRHPENRGLPAARNTGLAMARGKYIAYLDDDSSWIPEKTALQVEVLESYSRQKCLAYCGARWFANGELKREHIPSVRGLMADFIYRGGTLVTSCMMTSTDALRSIGGHSEDLTSCIDHDVWMKMAHAEFEMDFVPRGLVVYMEPDDRSQMKTRLHERLHGIEQFFIKWKSIVLQECGLACWRVIESVYHRQTVWTIKDQYLKGQISKQLALVYLRKLISVQSRPLLWADYLMFGSGGWRFLPVDQNLVKIARRAAPYPFRKIVRSLKE